MFTVQLINIILVEFQKYSWPLTKYRYMCLNINVYTIASTYVSVQFVFLD